MSVDRIAALEARLEELSALLAQPQSRRMPYVSGTFTPPSDLLPAVMRLSPEAFAYLQRLVGDRYPTAADLVAAADWYEQQQSRAVQ